MSDPATERGDEWAERVLLFSGFGEDVGEASYLTSLRGLST